MDYNFSSQSVQLNMKNSAQLIPVSFEIQDFIWQNSKFHPA